MENFESNQTTKKSSAIELVFAHRIDGKINDDAFWQLQDEAEREWDAAEAFELRQGDSTGTFKREGVKYCLGSLPGASVFIELDTEAGQESVQLRLEAGNPAFDITPIE